ncbi:MAG: hypothetical protein ABRQ39_25950 [Candidatus Eremiobacterota bacterium]
MSLINKIKTFLMNNKEQQTVYICPGCFRNNSNYDACSYCSREFNDPAFIVKNQSKAYGNAEDTGSS